MSILITSVLNCASDWLAISSLLSWIFCGALIYFFHLGQFFFWGGVSGAWYIVKGGALGVHQGGATHFPALCDNVCQEVSGREQCCLLYSLPVFSHLPCYPQSNWALLVLLPEWVGLCTFYNPVGLSSKLSCVARSFSCCHLNPHRCFQSVV